MRRGFRVAAYRNKTAKDAGLLAPHSPLLTFVLRSPVLPASTARDGPAYKARQEGDEQKNGCQNQPAAESCLRSGKEAVGGDKQRGVGGEQLRIAQRFHHKHHPERVQVCQQEDGCWVHLQARLVKAQEEPLVCHVQARSPVGVVQGLLPMPPGQPQCEGLPQQEPLV
jgi:hypothetical protein